MPTNRLNQLLFCSAVLACATSTWADESFHVIAPDAKGQQLLNFQVRTNDQGTFLEQRKSQSLAFPASSIAAFPDPKHFIVSTSSKTDKASAQAATFQLNRAGDLQLIASCSLQHPTGYTCIDRSGTHFMSVNYGSGRVSVYDVTAERGVGQLTCSFLALGKKETHCILPTRDNRFVYIPCVKTNNAILQFAYNEANGTLRTLEERDAHPPAMFGPRHIAYHPTLPIAYFSNEQQLGVSVYRISANGQLLAKQHAVTMPRRTPYQKGKRDLHASDLAVTNDGKRLFVAVRDFNGDEDSVYAFRIETDGRLSLQNRTIVGDIPWKLALSPSNQFLILSESFDGRLSVRKVNQDGSLPEIAGVQCDVEIRDMIVVDPGQP